MSSAASAEALDRRRLRRLACGEVNALAEIYDAHAPALFGLALWLTGSRADAEDVVQETMLKLATMGAGLLSVRRPRAYLMSMARNAAFDRRRRNEDSGEDRAPMGLRRRAGDLPPRGAREDSPAAGRPVGAAGSAEGAIDLRAAIGRLPLEQREVVFLHAIEGWTFREVGRVTDVSTFTAASRYRLALGRLREMLEPGPPGSPLPEDA